MKSAYLTGLRQLEICDELEPKITRPDEVLLRIDRVGICGSDVHYYLSGRIGDQVLKYPATVGHECAGTVVEIGPAVERLRPGDRVAVDPAIVCGQCDQCRGGRSNTCREVLFMGCPGEAPGALTEYCVLPEANCLPIPGNVTLEQAALAEPLSVALHAIRLAGDDPDLRGAKMGLSPSHGPDVRIAVLGAGPIGLGVLLCAKARAPCTAYVADLIDERLKVARRCGADWTGNAHRHDAAALIARQEPQGLDLVFECSGDPACIDQGQRLLAPGGTLVLVGIPPADRVGFDPHLARRKELSFRNVRRQRDCMIPAIQMIAEGQIDVSPLMTHRFALEQGREAFELVAGYRDGVIKAIVDVSAVQSGP
jgi:L-iditol 2-dehydrogenase